MASEWLLRFRALKAGVPISETCAKSANSANSPAEGSQFPSDTLESSPIGTIGAFGIQHSKRSQARERPNALVEIGSLSISKDSSAASGDLRFGPCAKRADSAKSAWVAQDWADFYEERVGIREYDGGYSRADAERLAWGELQNRWHLGQGERVSRDLCAGCRRPIGGDRVLDVIDGSRVHDTSDHVCLIQHGDRWRAAASRALMAMGLNPPRRDRAGAIFLEVGDIRSGGRGVRLRS